LKEDTRRTKTQHHKSRGHEDRFPPKRSGKGVIGREARGEFGLDGGGSESKYMEAKRVYMALK